MPFAVLNVRPRRQKTLAVVRIDNRNKDLAMRSLGQQVLLYAPHDEALHGYFGKAEITDVRLDLEHRRFMFLDLARINIFARPIRLEHVPEPLESQAYRADGKPAFSYFSTGIRLLSERDREAVFRLERALAVPAGLAAPPSGTYVPPPLPQRRLVTRAVVIRDAQLRWTVLDLYGAGCAVCGRNYSDRERGLYEVEVCHLQAVRYGGPDAITNAMPMCRTHHWAYDAGLFTLAPEGHILLSSRMNADLRNSFNGQNRALLPQAPAVRPAARHLLFHRDMVFQP
jgi:hypothetical protein